MKVLIPVLWLLVLGVAAYLRFDRLGERPFHADEANNARILSARLAGEAYTYDPTHFHGPTLTALAVPVAGAAGQRDWMTLTARPLRTVPAAAGVLLVLVPLLWRRRAGDVAALASAALLATSPLLVYYSRMYIHEMLLALWTLSTLAALVAIPREGRHRAGAAALAGVGLALMFATKGSIAITLIAWTGAALLAFRARIWPLRLHRHDLLVQWRLPLLAMAAVAIAISVWLFTDGLRRPAAMVDAVRTFFVYQTIGGHEKPVYYYLDLLLRPKLAGGVRWYETGIAILALAGCLASRGRARDGQVLPFRHGVRFLGYTVLGHVLIYSLIGYKTPWLMVVPWAHACLLAGGGIGLVARRNRIAGAVALAALAVVLHANITQARLASHRFGSDGRNPYAYVPTSRDAGNLQAMMLELRQVMQDEREVPLAVIGRGYWPLPWYLRGAGPAGYWAGAFEGMERMPVVLAMPWVAKEVGASLGGSHQAVFRGLREDVPVSVFVRGDVWERWLEGK